MEHEGYREVRGVWRVSVVLGYGFSLAAVEVDSVGAPVNIPGVSVCLSPSLSLPSHTHTHPVQPPHWLQHHYVTFRLIGCEADEGGKRDAEGERASERERGGRG